MHLHTFTQKKSKRTEGLSEDKKQWEPDISIPKYSLNFPSNHDSVIFPLLPHISQWPSYNSVPFRNEEKMEDFQVLLGLEIQGWDQQFKIVIFSQSLQAEMYQ